MKALAVLGPLFGIAASCTTIYWNLWARRKYAQNPKEEPLFKKTLRYALTAVVSLSIITLILLALFVVVASTLRDMG